MGKALVSNLKSKGHQLTLFTRGRHTLPSDVEHLKGDRKNNEDLRCLDNRNFDVIVDSSGRNLDETRLVLSHTGNPNHRFLYVSSAGVYANSDTWPLDEMSPLDPVSRHVGKADTENWLINEKIPFTSFRPTYIYGPGNYNPIESWFFDRITHDKPVPMPIKGDTITQLGHVSDLAEAMTLSLEFSIAENRIYNCSGKKGVTFLGLLKAACIAAGKTPNHLDIKSFDPSLLDPKARKVFPLRIGHFLTDISRIESDLDWKPKFDLIEGLSDSYNNDYLINRNLSPDFNHDDILDSF